MRKIRQAALARQVRRVEGRLEPLRLLNERLSLVRFVLFSAGIFIAIAIASYYPYRYALLIWLLFFGGFVWLVIQHNKLRENILQFEQWIKVKQEHIARMNLNWADMPLPNRTEKISPPIFCRFRSVRRTFYPPLARQYRFGRRK